MEKKITIAIVVVILSLIMFIMLITLLKKTDITQFLTQQTQPINKWNDNLTKCPQKFWVYWFVDIKQTRTNVKDDDVYITISNKEQDDYLIDVFVNGIFQGKVLARGNSTSQLISGLVTEWWRQGFDQPLQAEEETEDSSKDEEDLLNQRIFEITIFVEGCDIIEQEALTKTQGPSIVTGGGGGSGDPSGSRYSISITKPQGKILDD